ncbi:unnamed protein product (macronuclear) [Paramecium tetraurelia]|uniref:HTH psq-type domain-containing protein n=1 Tax=Paramecium tetraurelia TaxID=5888 RepID=A0DQI9_PARTE|nr:uncharacterized protein GSPATT00002706001 [Paramecium tetraurelia]CAK85306.1 unnamed protein product [Paramecium tetraurelia]|eukprot:XP_001452703.1 hypothetical protein (macronuclear) [Paramecium tetraurelia strain d4-2]
MNKASESEEILDPQNYSKSFNRKSNRPQHYQKVDANLRSQIIDQACNKGQPLRQVFNHNNMIQVAQNLGIKYSTAKAIVQVYQSEGRIGKKRTRDKRIYQEIETYILIVNKQTGKIEKLKHKSECNDLKTNFLNAKLNLEEAHYSQIAQYFGKYNLSLPQEHLEQQNESIINLMKILNEQYKQFQESDENKQ